jgi:hypothetical protein
MKRILPSERIRKGIDELLQEGTTGNLLGRCNVSHCSDSIAKIDLTHCRVD